MSKELNQKTIAQIKRIAANVSADVISREKMTAKRDELNAKINELTQRIDLQEAPVKLMTDGYTTSDLIKRVVEDTGKVDKEGRPIKVTKFVLKYPDTVFPPMPDTPEPAEETFENEETTEYETIETNNI